MLTNLKREPALKYLFATAVAIGSIFSAFPANAFWQLENPAYSPMTGRDRFGQYCSGNVTLDENANIRLSPNSSAELLANSGYGVNYTAYPLAQYGEWYLINFEVGRSNYVGWTHEVNVIGGPYSRCR